MKDVFYIGIIVTLFLILATRWFFSWWVARLIFYGPHACARCGRPICRISQNQGGQEYDYPAMPIYPNTEWTRHECAQIVETGLRYFPSVGQEVVGFGSRPASEDTALRDLVGEEQAQWLEKR